MEEVTIPCWQWILHVDMDSFFASVEQRDKPSLKGKPVVVGGAGARGVVSAASYEARKKGVHSAMPIVVAKSLCPEAVFLPVRFYAYRKASSEIMEILKSYTQLVEPLSLDEAFLDLNGGKETERGEEHQGDPVKALRMIKKEIQLKTGLTASAGAGRTKTLAKLASDARKPDGLLIITPSREKAFLESRPVKDLFGVGPMTLKKLEKLGIKTVRELIKYDLVALTSSLGENSANSLKNMASGKDERKVESKKEAKSISQEETFAKDKRDEGELQEEIVLQSKRVVKKLQEAKIAGKTVHLKIKFGNFTSITRSHSFLFPVDDADAVIPVFFKLLKEVDVSQGVRLLGVGISNLQEEVQEVFPFTTGASISNTIVGTSAAESEESGSSAFLANLQIGKELVHKTYGFGWVRSIEENWITVVFEEKNTETSLEKVFDRNLLQKHLF